MKNKHVVCFSFVFMALFGNASAHEASRDEAGLNFMVIASSPEEASLNAKRQLTDSKLPAKLINSIVDQVADISFADGGYTIARPRVKGQNPQVCLSVVNQNIRDSMDRFSPIAWAVVASAHSKDELDIFKDIGYEFIIAHERGHCRLNRVLPEKEKIMYEEIWKEETIADEYASKLMLNNQSFKREDILLFLMNLRKARTASVIAFSNVLYWTTYGIEQAIGIGNLKKPRYSLSDLNQLDQWAAKLRAAGFVRDPAGAKVFWEKEVQGDESSGFPSPRDVGEALQFRMDAVEKMFEWGLAQRPASK